MSTNSQIYKLDHFVSDMAKTIWQVFQSSYSVEADLIGVEHFPPLERTVNAIQSSQSEFYGFWEGDVLAGVVEVAPGQNYLDLCSLVVDPGYFRRGIAGKLIDFIFDRYHPATCEVETAVANLPAIKLYESKGFVADERWMTSFKIEKIKLTRTIIN